MLGLRLDRSCGDLSRRGWNRRHGRSDRCLHGGGLGDRSLWLLRGLVQRRLLLIGVVATYGVLELTHAPTQRAADLR